MNVYYYIYYRAYRLAKSTSMPWWTEFRVVIFLALVEMSLLALGEYKIASLFLLPGADMFGKWGYIVVIALPPFILNYFLFLYAKRWKGIIRYFDEADSQEKSKMNLQMAVVLLLVVGLFTILLML